MPSEWRLNSRWFYFCMSHNNPASAHSERKVKVQSAVGLVRPARLGVTTHRNPGRAHCQLQHPRRGQLRSPNSATATHVNTYSLTVYFTSLKEVWTSADGEIRDWLCAQYVPGAFTGKEAVSVHCVIKRNCCSCDRMNWWERGALLHASEFMSRAFHTRARGNHGSIKSKSAINPLHADMQEGITKQMCPSSLLTSLRDVCADQLQPKRQQALSSFWQLMSNIISPNSRRNQNKTHCDAPTARAVA